MNQRCNITGKISYSSPGLAKRRTAHMRSRTRAYRCEHCNRFHITNQDKG